jgi:hypothetical protein
MSGGVTIHTIFWAPFGYQFDAGYQGFIKKFLSDTGAMALPLPTLFRP